VKRITRIQGWIEVAKAQAFAWPGKILRRNFFPAYLILQTFGLTAQIQVNSGYGNDGMVKISIDDFNEPVAILKLENDSLLLLANLTHDEAQTKTDIALIKLLPDGSSCQSFGINGNARYDFAGMNVSNARSLIKLDDGRFLVLGSGYALANPAFQPACLMMLQPDGSVDSSFGTSGTLLLQFAGIEEFPRVLKQDAAGRILVGGFSTDSSHVHDDVPVVARLFANGSLDTTFGLSGKAYLRTPTSIVTAARHLIGGVLYDLLELGDGSLLAAGGYSNGNNLVAYIAHIKSDGNADTSFYDNGFLAIDFTPFANSQMVKLKQDACGLIWFAATSNAAQGRNFFTGNLNMLTGDFNTSEIDFDSREDVIADIQFNANNDPVLVGSSISPAHNYDWYLGDYISVTTGSQATFPYANTKFTFSDDTTRQCGAVSSVMLADGNLLVYGFKNKSDGRSELMLTALSLNENTGLTNNERKKAIRIYPNPANGTFTVTGNQAVSNVALTDASGKIVAYNITGPALVNKLDVSGLLPGIYFLGYTQNNTHSSVKVVVK
jgi:uncharacterized delta-60 repeat protein